MAFITTYGERDFSQLEQEALELLEAKFPGWKASRADQLRWLISGGAAIDADVFSQMTTLEKAAFQRFGEVMARVPRLQAAPAIVESTWTMVDDGGHKVEAGTEVGIPDPAGGQPFGFRTVDDLVIPPGSTKGNVQLQAIEPGTAANGLSGTPELETSLSFVVQPEGIELLAVTASGRDEEGEDEYLDRLVERLRLRSVALIVPYDFQVDALSYGGVGRALCIRGYNPEDESEGNAGMQCLFPIGGDGLEVGEDKEGEILAGQQAMLLEGVQHHVAPPEYTQVDVTSSALAEAGFDPVAIAAAMEQKLLEFFDPAKWGIPANGESSGWEDRRLVHRNDLITLLGRIGGLGHVVDVQLAKHGEPLGDADLELTGIACLTKPGTIETSAS